VELDARAVQGDVLYLDPDDLLQLQCCEHFIKDSAF